SCCLCFLCFFFSSRRRHTRSTRDWSSDVCSSDLGLNSGSWWLCWEDSQVGCGGPADGDYDDAVLFLESVNPTPVSSTSWGQLKRSEERRVGKGGRGGWWAEEDEMDRDETLLRMAY